VRLYASCISYGAKADMYHCPHPTDHSSIVVKEALSKEVTVCVSADCLTPDSLQSFDWLEGKHDANS
jgi:hypothetical protein